MYSIKVLLPLLSSGKTFYLKGYFFEPEPFKFVIYVTKYSTNKNILTDTDTSANIIHGHFGPHQLNKKYFKHSNYIQLNSDFDRTQKITLNGVDTVFPADCIIILYDYNKINESQVIPKSPIIDNHFSTLQTLIHKDNHINTDSVTGCYVQKYKISHWISASLLAQHVYCYINLLNWIQNSIRKQKKIQITQANFLFAIIIDLILGYLVLQLLIQDKEQLSIMLMDILENLLNSLFSLLKWLMGAPAGLKLNNAFNKMLGKYFSYHIQLWWLFLDVSGEKLGFILHVYQYLGYLGITFQAAMICDLICIATFHSYCIYVYAARLFNIQVSGLIALLRLFVGRKYNPLRGGIDSCEYTNQELFVGTVAFTILLLLLPTTAMYYTVFTLFRLLSLSIQYVLAKVIHHIQTMPLYVTILWLVRSPKVAGNIFIEVVSSTDVSPLVLNVKVLTKSLNDLVSNFKPPAEMVKPVEWTNLVSNVLTGKQII